MNGPQPVEVDTSGVAGPAGATTVDGRTARSTKTRDAIADALLDLLTEDELRPTARQIAERAGVSVRSVYVHFDDLEGLFCAAANRHFARMAPLLAPVPAAGPLAERAGALVRQRARLYTRGGAVARATQLHAALSPTLARLLRDARARGRADLERVFARELDDLDAAARVCVVSVLDTLTGAEAWQTLCERHDLTVDDATACLTHAIVLQLQGARA